MLHDYYDDFDCQVQCEEQEHEYNLLDLFDDDFYEEDPAESSEPPFD